MSTAHEPKKFNVESEYTRLIKNVQELYNADFISPTAARKASEKIRRWRKENVHRQIGTES